MKPLRICLVSRAPFLGGAEVACERLAIGLRDEGHRVKILVGAKDTEVTTRLQTAQLDWEHVDTVTRDKRHLARYLMARHRLRKLFRNWRPDIIHSNDLPTHQIVSSASRSLGIPRICHHRFVYDQPAIDWMNGAGAERHLFVSKYLQDHFTQSSDRIASAGCGVVYDGLPMPTPPSDADRKSARAALGLLDDKIVVLYAGQIVERKGVRDLIEAWSRLPPETAAKAQLILIGDDIQSGGEYRREMEQLARSLAVGAVFKGFRKDVPLWLTAADLAVVPSRIEPLGNATLEAMAHCLPVIGGKAGGIPEMVVHDETGLLVPPAEPEALMKAIAMLIQDPRRRRELAVAGRERCERLFSLEAHTRTVLAEYDRVRIHSASCVALS